MNHLLQALERRRDRANRMLANVEIDLQHVMRDSGSTFNERMALMNLYADLEDMFFDVCADIIDLRKLLA